MGDNIVDDNHIAPPPAAHSPQAPAGPLEVAGTVCLPRSHGPAHLDREIRATVWEPHRDAQPALRPEARDHPAAAKPGDNQRGSRSRNQPAGTHICPWDEYHWNWNCASGDEDGHRGRVMERVADWMRMLENPSLSC